MTHAIACTIAAANYLPFVRVLVRSFQANNPATPLKVLLVASEQECAAARQEGLDIVSVPDLAIAEFPEMLRRYGPKEICAALKPSLFLHLFDSGCGTLMFLDPDILVTHPLGPIFDVVGRHAMTLTPHIQIPQGRLDRGDLEKSILLAGLYNAGFIGVADTEATRRFLAWWQSRLRTHCFAAVKDGIHYDQRWLDHAMGFVGDLHILRDAGCNVAYWNMADYTWRIEGDRFQVNNMPLSFFHFSGYNPAEPTLVSRYSRWTIDRLGALGVLFRQYQGLLIDAGYPLATPNE